ncbi:FecR family protein [Pseudomonas paraeruginosa]|uniref:FecR family protein n=1 Tax=Pseudomonas paraeruginosa TaxID=2994495 RepID=UPI0039FBFB87
MKPTERVEPLFGEEAELDIDQRAAYWFSRRRSAHFSAACRLELDAWLRADPRHREALDGMERLWRELDGLPRPALDGVSAQASAWRLPRALAAVFFVFCAALVGVLFWRDQMLGPNLAYSTAPGEQREVLLADGSRLFLDVDTQVQVRYAEHTRDVLLKRGEAFFMVSHDPSRPFRVASGDSRVTVLGTQFSVRRDAQAFTVAVKQGRVALRPSLEKDGEQVLLAGDSARLDLADQRLRLGHVAPEQVASWRDGQLVFRDKPLGELVAELSRYRLAPIRLVDAGLAGKRVSGSVRIARPDDFLLALPALLPVRVQAQADGEVLILAR